MNYRRRKPRREPASAHRGEWDRAARAYHNDRKRAPFRPCYEHEECDMEECIYRAREEGRG